MLARVVAWGWWLGMWLLPSMAMAATGGELFAQGVGAFKNGNFASALSYFEQARVAGLDLPALHYNRGVSLYKLGRYPEAEDAFLVCARDAAWAPLAYYNAGLSAYQQDRRPQAAAHFDRAWRLSDDRQVRALAFTMLVRVDPAAGSRPRGAVSVNFGYNDNVTLSADSLTLQTASESDRFTEVLASLDGRWGAAANAPRWEASLYDLRYTDLKDNNLTALLLGASKSATFAAWYTDFSAQWEYVLRDGHRFQETASVQVEGVRDRTDQGDLRLALRLSAIDALDDNFAFLDGLRQDITASIGERIGSGRARVGISYERNDRADSATADEFFSFSPTRYGLWLRASWPLGAYWRLEPIARYTRSRYADPDRRASGVVATREDREQLYGVGARYRLGAFWQLFTDFLYTNNRSNFPELSYTQRIVSIGVTRRF